MMIQLNREECPNPTALQTSYKSSENKEALKRSSFGKCMYCESKISHIDYGDVEHIKPKSLYQDLKYDWDNLGFACIKCNRQYKNDKYSEDTPYINPFEENPSDFIIMSGSLLFQKRGSERGEITIIDIGLNRPELIEKRQEKINQINNAIKSCFRTQNKTLKENALEALKLEANDDKEFSLAVKALLKNHGVIE